MQKMRAKIRLDVQVAPVLNELIEDEENDSVRDGGVPAGGAEESSL